MKIVLLSDTHGQHRKLEVPAGDVLVHAGDICQSMGFSGRMRDLRNEEEIRDFNDWLGTLPHKHKVVIAGNHDFLFQRKKWEARGLITNATYLEDSSCMIEGVRFYGSPWQPAMGWWAFNEYREKLADRWSSIPDDTGVLITHGPPNGICDLAGGIENAGCEALLSRVREVRPLLHVFGHIHEGRGVHTEGGTFFYNAALVDNRYHIAHAPIVHDLSLTPEEALNELARLTEAMGLYPWQEKEDEP